MFAWYDESAVCIAFLEDVDGLSLSTEEPHPKWLTRGWTLQELTYCPMKS